MKYAPYLWGIVALSVIVFLLTRIASLTSESKEFVIRTTVR
jgi:heme exporter protein D